MSTKPHEAVRYQIEKMRRTYDSGWGKARLAQLRRAIGHSAQDVPELGDVYLNVDRDSDNRWIKDLTPQEKAVFTTMTLYALGQQGRHPDTDCVSVEGVDLGTALGHLAGPDESKQERIRRKMKALFSAKTDQAVATHLRSLIQLLKQGDVRLDYPQLADDIAWLSVAAKRSKIHMKWARGFLKATAPVVDKETKE